MYIYIYIVSFPLYSLEKKGGKSVVCVYYGLKEKTVCQRVS